MMVMLCHPILLIVREIWRVLSSDSDEGQATQNKKREILELHSALVERESSILCSNTTIKSQ
jgi:hypothetical protein